MKNEALNIMRRNNFTQLIVDVYLADKQPVTITCVNGDQFDIVPRKLGFAKSGEKMHSWYMNGAHITDRMLDIIEFDNVMENILILNCGK